MLRSTLKRLLGSTLLSFLLLVLWPGPGKAQSPETARSAQVTVEGEPFARRVQVAGSNLQLNGTGVRAVAWFKGFAAGLYLTRSAGRAEQVVAAPGAKRLQLRMLQNVPAAEFVKAFDKGVSRNTPPDELPGLADRMARFDALVNQAGNVRKRDVVDLDFDPARGLVFSLNGKTLGEPIAGADFYAALLRAFVGDKPYDDKLKAGLLGQAG